MAYMPEILQDSPEDGHILNISVFDGIFHILFDHAVCEFP